jgi:hypothetical protein
MSAPASLAAFARMHASHTAFLASYRTDQRPAAIVESKAADVEFMAAMPGNAVLVKAEWEKSGVAPGTVSMAFENGDVRTEHGVKNWGDFCPASYSLSEAQAFFRGAEESLERACALDDFVPAAGIQTTLLF